MTSKTGWTKKEYVLHRRISVLEDEIRQLVAASGRCDPTVHTGWNGHKQACPDCPEEPLMILWNYAGAGSHYWHLICENCGKEFNYDNHSSQLTEIQ